MHGGVHVRPVTCVMRYMDVVRLFPLTNSLFHSKLALSPVRHSKADSSFCHCNIMSCMEWIYIDRHDDGPTEVGHVIAFIRRLRSLWLVPVDMHLAAPCCFPVSFVCPSPFTSSIISFRVWFSSATTDLHQRRVLS